MSIESSDYEFHLGEEAISECLETRRIGFKEISQETSMSVFERAPKGITFIVPDKRYAEHYKRLAETIKREDFKFTVEDRQDDLDV